MMKNIKFLINAIFCLGITSAVLGCSNEIDNSNIYSDKEFHTEVVKLQNRYNSSLKVDESILNKDDETLTNINDILCTIENSSFEYELIESEEGGLIAMPILTTTATRSSSAEVSVPTYTETISHSLLPCRLKIRCSGTNLTIKAEDSLYEVSNISCTGSYTKEAKYERFRMEGHIKIAFKGSSNYTRYYIFRLAEGDLNHFEIHEVLL